MPINLGNFGSNFASSFGAAQEQRRLRDVFKYQQQTDQRNYDYKVEQDKRDEEFRQLQLETQKQQFERQQSETEAYHEAQRQLDAARLDFEKSSADFRTFTETLELLKTNRTPGARKIMSKQLAKRLGIDTKSQEYKDIESYVVGLDQFDAKQMSQTLALFADHAKPGEIDALVKGWMSGNLTMAQIIEGAQKIDEKRRREGYYQNSPQAQQAPAQAAQQLSAATGRELLLNPGELSRAPGARLTGGYTEQGAVQDPNNPAAADSRVNATQSPIPPEIQSYLDRANEAFRNGDMEDGRAILSELNAIKDELPGTIKRRLEYETAKIEAQAQADQRVKENTPVDRKLVQALGLDTSKRWTAADLNKEGYTAISQNPDRQLKDADELTSTARGTIQTMSSIAKLIKQFDGKPQTLGFDAKLISAVETFNKQLEGLQNITGIDLKPLEKKAEDVANGLVRDFNLTATAKDIALIKSGTLALAYDLALTEGLAGSRLTNSRVEDFLNQIGQSGNPDTFKATLESLFTQTMDNYTRKAFSITGKEGAFPNPKLLTKSDLEALAQHPQLIPTEYLRAIVAAQGTR